MKYCPVCQKFLGVSRLYEYVCSAECYEKFEIQKGEVKNP